MTEVESGEDYFSRYCLFKWNTFKWTNANIQGCAKEWIHQMVGNRSGSEGFVLFQSLSEIIRVPVGKECILLTPSCSFPSGRPIKISLHSSMGSWGQRRSKPSDASELNIAARSWLWSCSSSLDVCQQTDDITDQTIISGFVSILF